MAHCGCVSLEFMAQAQMVILTAAAVLSTISATATYLLILFNPGTHNWIHWTTFCLPVVPLLLVIATITADFVTRSDLMSAPDIEQVTNNAAFWLPILALVSVTGWSGLVEYIRWLALQKSPKRRNREEEESKGWDWWSLWPWGR